MAPKPETGKPRGTRKGSKKTRGPRVFVKYEVVDGSGQPISGAVARVLRIERDQNKILEMTLNHTLDGNYMLVDVPIASQEQPKAETVTEQTDLAQAAE